MTDGAYKLHCRAGTGSLAVQMVLEEIGAPYELIWVDKAAQVSQRTNPLGKVPVLVAPDGTSVFESAAILIHLTLAHPAARLAPLVGSAAHARFLQWMVFLSANVYETALRYFYPDRYSTAGMLAQEGIKEQALADYYRHLEVVHDILSPYVLGETFSAADPYLYMFAGWFPREASLSSRLPKLAKHADLLRRRPATIKSDKDHG
jgi:glutathione S-transferase